MIVRHLAVVGAGEDLAKVFDGRMFWPEAVDAELKLQSRGIPALRSFLADYRPTVPEFDPDEDIEIAEIRLEMYAKKDLRVSDTEHLGEAQCLFLCDRDRVALVTNDGAARQRARAMKIPLFHVVDVQHLMVRLGIRKPASAWDVYVRAVNDGGLFELPGYPVATSRERFMQVAATVRALYLAEQTVVLPAPKPASRRSAE
jgi:hypothetical protein